MTYNYTYIVECSDKKGIITYYVGGTNDPRQRITDHLAGRGARYLKGRKIIRVIYTDKLTDTLYSEYVVKHRWSANKKRLFVEHAFIKGEHVWWQPLWAIGVWPDGGFVGVDV
jgi:putative endonuclease